MKIAKDSKNSKLQRLLIDEMLFHLTPFYTPTFLSALSIVTAAVSVHYLGWILGCVVTLVLYTTALSQGLQTTVLRHKSRIAFGTLLGFFAVLVGTFMAYIQVHLGFVTRLVATCLVGISCYLIFAFHTKRPQVVKIPDRFSFSQHLHVVT